MNQPVIASHAKGEAIHPSRPTPSRHAGRHPGEGRDRHPRLTSPRAIFLLCLAACLAADFLLARALIPNGDSVQSYNEMLAIRAGNPLLHNWVLATDNDLLTDLPPVLFASLIFGAGPHLTYLAPFLVFAALLAACLFLIRALAPGPRERLAGAYALLLLLGVPYGLPSNFYFWSCFHISTLALCLYAILAIEPALSLRKFSRWRLLPFTILLAMMVFSDPIVDPLLLAPLLLLLALRAWLAGKPRLDDALIGLSALLAFAAAWFARHAVHRLGGFETGEAVTASFVPAVHNLLANLWVLLNGGQLLFTARAALLRGLPLPHLIAAGGLVEAALILAFAAAAAWAAPRAPQAGVAHLLLLGAAGLALAEAMSRTFTLSIAGGAGFPGPATRFAIPLFAFLSLAAILHGMGRLAKAGPTPRRAAAALLALLAIPHALGALAAAATALHQTPGLATARQRPLLNWLRAHHLTHGVGDYWDTQVLTALSRGQILADPMLQTPAGQLVFYRWITDTSRFAHPAPPQFVIIRPGNPGGLTLAGAAATYGPLASVARVGDYQIALYATPPAQNPAPPR